MEIVLLGVSALSALFKLERSVRKARQFNTARVPMPFGDCYIRPQLQHHFMPTPLYGKRPAIPEKQIPGLLQLIPILQPPGTSRNFDLVPAFLSIQKPSWLRESSSRRWTSCLRKWQKERKFSTASSRRFINPAMDRKRTNLRMRSSEKSKNFNDIGIKSKPGRLGTRSKIRSHSLSNESS